MSSSPRMNELRRKGIWQVEMLASSLIFFWPPCFDHMTFVMDSVKYIKKEKQKPWNLEVIKPGQYRFPCLLRFDLRKVIPPKFDFFISRLEIVVVYKLLEELEMIMFNVKHWHRADAP